MNFDSHWEFKLIEDYPNEKQILLPLIHEKFKNPTS
jgi:hypothetical protein